jgi:glycosyltransferase involved in cell wall biosynthesis
MVRAGIESWLKSLVRFANPRRLRFTRCVVTSSLSDPRVMREMPVPVEVGGCESVQRAARDCDVLLVSGPAEVASWLGDHRPPLCVGVAHGDAVWTRNILERCAPAFDHVIAVSRTVEERVCQGFHSTVIYNGVDLSHVTRTLPRDEARARFGFSSSDFVVGSVMRLSSEKCPELLVQAVARLPKHVKLFLVGWGPLRHKLLDLANDLAPMRCVIAPADEHLGDYYHAFDAFCLPSESEGFGLATLEAQFCGLPVVTTRTGYAPELLQDGVHYLQCAGTVDSVANCLVRLDANREWAATLGREGQRQAERFGFATRMCRDYEALLDRLWRNRRPRAC